MGNGDDGGGGGGGRGVDMSQYSYKATSNLVLRQDRRGRRNTAGADEVQPFRVGSLDGAMGDRALVPGASRKRRLPDAAAPPRVRRRRLADGAARDVVAAAEELGLDAGGVRYVPRTRLSQMAFEGVLAFVLSKMGDLPRDVLRDAAEEVVAVLKGEGERKGGVEKVLGGGMSEDEFVRLCTFARQIKDFGVEEEVEVRSNGGEAEEDMIDEEQGVAVVFDDDDDEGDDDRPALAAFGENVEYLDAVVEPEDASSDGDAADGAADADVIRGDVLDEADALAEAPAARDDDATDAAGFDMFGDEPVLPVRRAAGAPAPLDVREIDAFWLQRQLAPVYADSEECQRVADGVFDALAGAGDVRALENRLAALVGYDKFDLVKRLIRHRAVVVFCMRRARAATDEERAAVDAGVGGDKECVQALRVLVGGRKRARRGAMPSAAAVEERIAEEKAKAVRVERSILRAGMAPSNLQLRTLDLKDLAFSQGGHLVSVKECRLPGSVHNTYRDYEEWHVPATRATDGKDGAGRLVPIADLPEWARPVFENTKSLNRVQSKVYPCAFESDENMLLCAPTGAGKTNVAVLTILRAVQNAMSPSGAVDMGAFKVVYVAPMKALVAEVVSNLGARLEKLGLAVRELTGDVNLSKREIDETQVIVTTPEKWDIITRKAGERTFTTLVRLLIVDEVHLLHDERGPVLEAIIARTIRSVETTAANTRVVGLSATLPNYRDVATFMRVDLEAGLFHFDSSFRPCPLEQCFVGITTKKALKRFQLMNELAYDKVKAQVNGGNQVIVFVHSRKDTRLMAKFLVDKAIEDEIIDRFMMPGSGSHEIVKSELAGVQSKELAHLLENGVAIHHAGMSRSDRTLVEDLFDARHVKVLVSTATLAWGVNLPARAVVIRGTQVYSPAEGRWVELSPMDIMQMMGRAGRPQHDSRGEGFIITTKAEVLFYLSVLNQQLPIESQMITRLCDTVNAEVALGTISSVTEGSVWLGYTYLYVRMLRHPTLYGVSVDEKEADPILERRRLDLIHSALCILDNGGLVKYDKRRGQVRSTDLGRVAADFYIGHETMGVYAQHLKPSLSDIDLLRLFALSGEFKYMRVRDEEKLELIRLADRVPIPVKESLDEPSAKVNILLQAFVSNLKLDGLALAADMVYVTQSAGRLARALLQIAIGRRWANLVERCLAFSKMVSKRQWTSQSPLRQFHPAVSDDIIRRIERIDMDFERYYDLTAAETGELLRNPKLGKLVHRLVHSLPRLDVEVSRVQPISRSLLRIEVVLTPDFRFDSSLHGFGEPFWAWVEDADSERLLHVEPFYLRSSVAGDHEHVLSFVVPVSSPVPPQYFVRCVSDRWITPDSVTPVSFRKLILPGKFPPHTELLEMHPLSIADAFSGEQGEKDDRSTVEDAGGFQVAMRELSNTFEEVFSNLNPLQTQAYPVLFQSDKNCVISAPSGTGRFMCAELALARLFSRRPSSRAVYIVGRGDVVVRRRVEELRKRIGAALALEVSELTGEASVDLALLKMPGSIVVATPEKWDMFSRKWQRKKEGQAIAKVGLILLDDAHLIGEHAERGPVIEVIGSRMRYIAVQMASEAAEAGGVSGAEHAQCRIVALMDPISNAKDVGHWLGAPPSHVISFHPSVRPVPLSIVIEPVVFRAGGGVAGSSPALVRPVYRAIRKNIAKESDGVVVFVASRRIARGLALELVMAAAAEGIPDLFCDEGAMSDSSTFEKVRVNTLRECLLKGVGYLHETLAQSDCEIVEDAYRRGNVQVLVSTAEYAWKSGAVGGRVVILAGTSTQESGGYALSRAEYPMSEIAHMMGRSGRQRSGLPLEPEDKGVFVIMSEPSLRDHYRRLTRDALPVESFLDTALADQINAEVGSGVIQTKQQAVDYLTWTLFYRRLPMNPNFYNMAGNSHRFIQDHLSDLVERSLSDLEASKCVSTVGDEDMALGSLNLGMIASHYYIKHSTIELFASSVNPRTKLRGLLDILALSSEFDALPVRIGEEPPLSALLLRVPVPLTQPGAPAPSLSDAHVKAHLLLQSHLARLPLAGDLSGDREAVLAEVLRLLRALVDVLSSAGWLKPALKAMELSQLFVQALWESDASVAQLPHLTPAVVASLKQDHDVDSVDALLDMDDADRADALSALSRAQVSDVAAACNTFPDIQEISAAPSAREAAPGESISVAVLLERGDVDDDAPKARAKKTPVPQVACARYPKRKEEGWWVVVGHPDTNALLGLKYVAFGARQKVKVDVSVPHAPGTYELEVYLISDSYVADCDQQDSFELSVVDAGGVDAGGADAGGVDEGGAAK